MWTTSGFLGLDGHECGCLYVCSMNQGYYHPDSSIKLFCLQIFTDAASCSCRNGWAEHPHFCSASCKASFRHDNGVKPKVFRSGVFPPVQRGENFVTTSRSHQAQTGINPPGLNFQTFLISWGAKTSVHNSKWELSFCSDKIIWRAQPLLLYSHC